MTRLVQVYGCIPFGYRPPSIQRAERENQKARKQRLFEFDFRERFPKKFRKH